jgi:hypothetical protein
MPSIRPVLIVGAGDLSDLAAALRDRGFGPMLAPNVGQAARLLRNFRVDVVIGAGLSTEDMRRLAERAPTVAVGGSESAAWEAGAAGFADAETAVTGVTEVVENVASGRRRVRAEPAARRSRDIA